LKAAIYARMSTDKQSADSPADQIARCREFAAPRDWNVIDELVMVDAARSSASSKRRETRWRGRVREPRIVIRTADDLMPRLREKLQDLEAMLRADLAAGRLTLGALFGSQRLRVHSDGRIEGVATIPPDEKLPAPRLARAGSCVGSGGGI
jgi:hypothetical protein